MLAMQAEMGHPGLPSHAFLAVALKSLSRVLLSRWTDRDVSMKHVRIKQE